MPRVIENIDSDANQRHTILLEDSEVVINLKYFSPTQEWFIDVEYLGRTLSGTRLAVGVLHMESANFPFDFTVTDTSGEGLDPFQLTDFEDGRCILYMLDEDDMFEIRGVEVPA